MNPVPWQREMLEIEKYFSSLIDQLPFGFGMTRHTLPKVDVYQTETDVVVKAEIPGVSKEDLNVYVEENHVRLSGQTKKSEEIKEDNMYRSERYFGSFSRIIPLPAAVRQNEAKAEYKDGILTLTIPKEQNDAGKGRNIEIQ